MPAAPLSESCPKDQPQGSTTLASEDDPWLDRRARVRAQLKRALDWEAAIRDGSVANRAEIAQAEGISRARVTQVMKLLELAGDIQREILDEGRRGPMPTERQLRKLAGVRPQELQNVRYRKMVGDLAPPRVVEWTGRKRPESRVRRRGFAHLFEQARRYQAMLDSGEYATLEAIGREVGVTGTRVGQVLNLLHLAPEIIEVLDVEGDRAPEGITTKDVRRLARMRDLREQLMAFEGMILEGRGH